MFNLMGGVERTQTPEWYVEMLRGNHRELCVHSLQVPTLNNKTFLNPYYTFIPKTRNKTIHSFEQRTIHLNTQICRAEELKAVQKRAWQERKA